MNKKTKIILIIVSVVAIFLALFILLTREVPSTTSAGNEKIVDDVTVSNLRFNDAKLTKTSFKSIF